MRLDHVAFICRDTAATTRFYGELLGLPLTEFDHGGEPMLMFKLPAAGMLIFTVRPTARAITIDEREWQQRHIGLAVRTAAELDTWLTRLRAHSIHHTLVDEERVYFTDPDGHVLEIEIDPRA